MKAFLVLLVLVGGVLEVCRSQSGRSEQAQPPFSISIQALHSEVSVGTPIELTIRLKNTSNHDLNGSSAYYGGVDYGYDYEVKTESGRIIRPKSGPGDENPPHASLRLTTLKSGETAEENTAVPSEFELSKPGKYQIQVSRQVPGEPQSVIKSNVITFKVVP